MVRFSCGHSFGRGELRQTWPELNVRPTSDGSRIDPISETRPRGKPIAHRNLMPVSLESVPPEMNQVLCKQTSKETALAVPF